MRKTSVAVMVIFFPKVSFRKYLITAIFKVFSQQLQGTLTTAFERHLPTEDLDMDQHRCRACNIALTYYCMLVSLRKA